ncbi:hypothetical protein [Lactococcus formosensis]|uniref:hypothetical protein n=1 Tax=Lactococcus formosensis TaxID=1281486 RepID=UPI0007CB9CDF|nr:hypothetical protein [Lactococcus formosensis]BAV01999.1 Helix-turn-helix domain, rpiR family [Lactococcus formosensis]
MEKLSDAEMYTWEFLEENKSKVQLMSITQIAEEAHVSTATIVRTLKKEDLMALPISKILSKEIKMEPMRKKTR